VAGLDCITVGAKSAAGLDCITVGAKSVAGLDFFVGGVHCTTENHQWQSGTGVLWSIMLLLLLSVWQ
jgi:hypothetical protein